MKSGIKRIRRDHRDYDFHRTFGSTFLDTVSLPPELNLDAGLWTPDQNAMGLPYGCTGMTQADLCTDEDGTIRDPYDVYENTPPGGDGPRDIRQSLGVLINRGVRTYLGADGPGNKRAAYFNIRAAGALDWFDAVRVALYSTQDERRSASVGTPWYPEFELPLMGGILPMPASFSTSRATWHNWKICGWKTIGGSTYLVGKSWQGPDYADAGFHYVSRELFNRLMEIPGTAAFTVTKVPPGSIETVDLGIVATIVSFIRAIFHV